MNELYSFDTVNNYNVIVETLDDGRFEALVYKIDPRNPNEWKTFTDAEKARNWGLMTAEKLSCK